MADRATETTTIAAPPDVVRAILLDFPRYPEWAKDLKSVEVLGTDDQGRATDVRFRAAGFGRSTNYTLTYDHAEANVTTFMAYAPQTRSTRSFDLQFRDEQWKICQAPTG